MTREERAARVADLARWIEETSREWEDHPFPDNVQDEWERNNRELREHQIVLAELQDRDGDLRQLAAGGHVEGGAIGMAYGSERTVDGSRRGDAPFIRLSDGRRATVARGESYRRHPVVADAERASRERDKHVLGLHGSFGDLIRSMSTTSGSAVVPTVWASDIIDRARNLAAVTRAGAQLTPMDAKVVQIGRLTTDPTAAFRAEGSTVTASDPVFDNVTLTAKTLSALVVGSMEWFQDAPNVDEIVKNAIAQAIAQTLDQQALFGGVVARGETGATAFNTTFPTPPNPRGVLASLLADAASSVLGGGANGTAQTAATFWNEIIDTIFQPQLFNEAPNAMLWSSTMAKFYAKTYNTQNDPMRVPPVVEAMERLVTNQIPSSFTQGTSTTNMTDVFCGDWKQLLIGNRLGLQVQTLTERYAELGQLGIIAHWRGDVGLARPRAFSVYRYLKSN